MAGRELTDIQQRVLTLVCDDGPYTTSMHLAKKLPWTINVIQHTLDALTRRNLVTPSSHWGPYVIYEPTRRGRQATY